MPGARRTPATLRSEPAASSTTAQPPHPAPTDRGLARVPFRHLAGRPPTMPLERLTAGCRRARAITTAAPRRIATRAAASAMGAPPAAPTAQAPTGAGSRLGACSTTASADRLRQRPVQRKLLPRRRFLAFLVAPRPH